MLRGRRRLNSPPGGQRASLHGVPIGIKDIIDVAGLPTTAHSKILVDGQYSANRDAACVSSLRTAGAIIMGKLSTHEFAIGGLQLRPSIPPSAQSLEPKASLLAAPHQAFRRWAGVRDVSIGAGTYDTLAVLSVIRPASAALSAWKPTYGLVSRRGVFPLAFTLDHVGPMTRTVADNALLLDALASHDPEDPGSAQTNVRHFGATLGRGVAGLRIGFVRHSRNGHARASGRYCVRWKTWSGFLQAEGALVETVTLPKLSEFGGHQSRDPLLGSMVHSREVAPRTAWRLWRACPPPVALPGAFMTAGDYVGAQRRRAELIAAVNDKLRDYDVLMCASSMDPASEIDDAVETARTYPRTGARPVPQRDRPSRIGDDVRTFGATACRFPCNSSAAISEDPTVLRVAAAYEKAEGWYKKHPPI